MNAMKSARDSSPIFLKRFRNYKSWEPVPSVGDIPSASPDGLNGSLFSSSICRSSF